MLADFPIDLEGFSRQSCLRLGRLARRLGRAMDRALAFKRNAGKRVGTYNLARCRKITDQSDRIFAEMMRLEDVWPDVELLVAQVVKTDFEQASRERQRPEDSGLSLAPRGRQSIAQGASPGKKSG
jgi:hypothetical protein